MKNSVLIDLGNSTCKVAFATGNKIGADARSGVGEDPMTFLKGHLGEALYDVIAFSSVQRYDHQLVEWLQSRCRKLIVVDGDTPTVLQIDYKTPDRLGGDLLAAGAGAVTHYPGKDLVIFGFGTAITVEEIDKTGKLVGIKISPGLQMRLNALHHFTGALPLVHLSQDEQIPDIGIDTRSAIASGVVHGIVAEIECYISKNQGKTIIFTGGDALFFAKKIKTPIFADCNLVLTGLAEIAKHYVA